MKISEAKLFGAGKLDQNGIPNAARETGSLLARAICRETSFLFAHPEYELSPDEERRFVEFIVRRAAHEPFQYIVGRQEFFGLEFALTIDVLIPRPETELLVERSIGVLGGLERARFLEIGVGSGCVAVSILVNVPHSTAVAVDISSGAIDVAMRNAETHDVASRIEIIRSDIFENVRPEKFDLIVSNPPYVPAADLAGLQSEVRDHEPHIALSDGDSGLTIIERIIDEAPDFLKPDGQLLMEIGFGQAEAVREMFGGEAWEGVHFEDDLQGIPRMVVAKLA